MTEPEEMVRRYAAELENMRRRSSGQREAVRLQERRELLGGMLDLVDGFERALAVPGGDPAWLAGFEGLHQQLVNYLAGFEVVPFGAEGDVFDPLRHEAMAVDPDAAVPPGCVSKILSKGYLMGEEVLRPARVAVSAE